MAASGRRPVAAFMFSRTWATLVVAGIAQVTAGCEMMNFRTNCAQLVASISAAHGGSCARASARSERAFAERPVDDHRDAAIARERQDPLLGLAIDRVVGDLHEVDRLAPHDLLDVAVATTFGRRDADVAKLSRRLHREQRRQVLLPVEQVVDLQQIEAVHLPLAARALDLLAALPRPTRSRPCRRRRCVR